MQIGAYELRERKIVSDEFYVYFDLGTNKIQKIVNILSEECKEGFGSFVTTYNEVSKILSGDTNLDDSEVWFNPEVKQYQIKDFRYQDPDVVKEQIFKMSYVEDADVKVVIDYATTCWKFYISENFRSTLKKYNVSINSTLYFSVTEKGNPNVLYKLMKVPFKELVNKFYYVVPFDSKFEIDKTDFSVYTVKKFDTYSLEVINE
jgi:hypothetical protein